MTGIKEAYTGTSLTMDVDTTWASSSARNGYDGDTVSIVGMNRSYDTYGGGGNGTLIATAQNDALLYDTSASTKHDLNGVAVADAHHFAGIVQFVMGAGDDVLDLTAPGGAGSYGTGVRAYGDLYNSGISSGTGGNDVVWTGAGNDEVYGDSGGGLSLNLVGGNDGLHGGAGADKLYGDTDFAAGDASRLGDDLLDGGTGDDLLFGDAQSINGTLARGHNTFAFDGPGSGQDTIGTNAANGFQHGLDHLQLSTKYHYTAGEALANTADDGSGNAVVDLGTHGGQHDTITLVGVHTAGLTADDFTIA